MLSIRSIRHKPTSPPLPYGSSHTQRRTKSSTWMKTSVLMRLLAQKDLSYFRNKKVQLVPKNVFICHLLRLIQRLLWIHLIFPLLRFSFQWLIFWNINMFMNQTYLRQNIIHKEKYLSFLMLMGSFFKMCFLNKLMR